MLRGFNQAKEKSYIGAMAEYLTRYPRSVALACADPFDGVVAGTKYLPAPSDVIAFCERKKRPLVEDAERERRIDEQLRMREEFERQVVADGLKAKGKAWLDRTDPIAQEVSKQRPKGKPTPEQVEELMADARTVAAEINRGQLKLSDEAIEQLKARQATADMDEPAEQ